MSRFSNKPEPKPLNCTNSIAEIEDVCDDKRGYRLRAIL